MNGGGNWPSEQGMDYAPETVAVISRLKWLKPK